MIPIRITLPWPGAQLSPNKRQHWAQHHKAKRDAKYLAYYAAVPYQHERIAPELQAVITFHPPDRRSYDLDNLIARMKASIDGVADGLRIDDARIKDIRGILEGFYPGGLVVIDLTAAPK